MEHASILFPGTVNGSDVNSNTKEKMSVKTGVKEGRDLMLYLNKGDAGSPQWKPTALATSHKYSFKSETKERITKESGKWAKKVVTKMSVNITCDALQSYDAEVGLKEFKLAAKQGTPVLLKYGNTSEAVGDSYETGEFIIVSVEESSQAGEDATYSVSFESSGEITDAQVSGDS